MFSRARTAFDDLADGSESSDPEGFSVLSQVRSSVPGYVEVMESFISRNPHSVHVPQIRWHHALNLFENHEYDAAGEVLGNIRNKDLYKSQRLEYLFIKAYCDLENRDLESAKSNFAKVEKSSSPDYAAPSRYALGYINYVQKDFPEAIRWFEMSRKDGRFAQPSCYYIMESHFMLGNHKYVTDNADSMYEAVSDERKPHLARIISESWLVSGDADNARRYLDLNTQGGQQKTRADWFFQGSVLYAVEDYKGAIESYSMMGERRDSIGQVADYHMGYSYIQTKNKVAAMAAFRNASSLSYDANISEDAFFNWAKLAFDLNSDTSVFQDYLERYPSLRRNDRINSYIAVAALHDRDYESAINAYDKIDDLDEDMRINYLKANYLRANQLISSGSYRKAIPCLKVASYYSEKGSRLNQLTRFWLAESYYRNDQYREAREIFTDLYNTSALYGRAESYQISYNIAYCYFKENNYATAAKWFTEYLGEESVKYRKDAMERRADCHFIRADYASAAAAYDNVLKNYYNVNDIYPYYQAALSHGLAQNPDRKIELLSGVLKASPSAKFYPEALFELGRTYAVREDDEKAFMCFNRLAQTVKDTTFVAQAYIEMGSISRNQSQFNDALKYYKTVVEKMPMSGYAEDALAAIESIYQTKDEPEEYIAYIETIGKGATKTADEKEDMIFGSAERIFLAENHDRALVSLQSYKEKYPDGRYVYKADFYMAESYKKLGKLEQACDSYRKVIDGGSGYAEDALAAIESIYQTKDEPEEYIAYIETIGKGATKTADEKEDMIFGSAERIFLAENHDRALVSLQSYKEKYPDGRYVYKADFYMAESYKKLGKLEQACDSYRKVIDGGEGSFVELSMLNFSDISYRLEKWDDAYGGYSSLFSSALLENNKFVAMTGMMRSAYRGHEWAKAIENADHLLYDSRSDGRLKMEADYIKAKSFLATSRREEAFAILARLAKDVSDPYGAEAAYMLIQDCYDRGAFEDVETKVYAFADAGSDQVYWLAKSFIVLGDSFAEREEFEQAKATFESVRDGYEPGGADDDVINDVEMRLERMESIMSEQN